MLERLDEVPSGEVNAAYGPAEWVPEAIRGLLDPDPDARDAALDWIYEGTYHQQTADEATPHVVPFLIELAADPAVPDRSRLLTFVAQVVGLETIYPIVDREDEDREDEYQEDEDQGAAEIVADEALPNNSESVHQNHWQACQAAAWRDADVLFGLLDDRDPDVRVAAGLVLAVLVQDGIAVLPAEAPAQIAGRLREAISRETDPVVRVGHFLGLGAMASQHSESRDWLRTTEAAADLDDPAGLAAAICVIDLGEPLDETGSQRFVERTLRFDPVAYQSLPWWFNPDPDDDAYPEVEDIIRTRFAQLAKRHPGLVELMRERAATGPPAERANALRLLAGRNAGGGKTIGNPPGPVEPDAHILVRIAMAEVEVSRNDLRRLEDTLPAAVEALKHPDASIRVRAAGVLKSLGTGEVAPRADEVAAIVQHEREPSVVKALARVFQAHSFHRGRIVEPFLNLLQAWLEAPDGPRDRRVRQRLWESMTRYANRAPAEALAPWVTHWIHDPARIASLDLDRGAAVTLYRHVALPGSALLATLGRLLREDPDPRVRRAAVLSSSFVVKSFDQLPPAGAILEAVRHDPSAAVRIAATQATGRFLMDTEYDPGLAVAIVHSLARALDDDPSSYVRKAAAHSLGLAAPTREEAQGPMARLLTWNAAIGQSSPGNDEAVQALVRAAANDPRHAVRRAVCHSLQNVASAVPGLMALLRSGSPHARAGAAEALESVGKQAGMRVLPELLDLLGTEPEVAVRRQIAHAVWGCILGEKVKRWIGPLARALRDPDAEVRDWIARGLYHAGPSAAPLASELADCLRIGHESLRRNVLETLARIGPKAGVALPAVMELVRSPSIEVQLLAMKAAWDIHGRQPIPVGELLDALERLWSDPNHFRRCDVMRQLGAIAAGLTPDRPERERAIALLRVGRSDRNSDVRDTARQGLEGVKIVDDDPDEDQEPW
jgi:HEAT repeat protein